jgi:hypothetical protein
MKIRTLAAALLLAATFFAAVPTRAATPRRRRTYIILIAGVRVPRSLKVYTPAPPSYPAPLAAAYLLPTPRAAARLVR